MKKITTSGKKFVDSDGRQRIFNGVNLCDKGRLDSDQSRPGAGKYYAFDFDEELIKRLSRNGFNLVRLGMTWDAVEPRPREYDEEYLDRVQKVADLCEKYGIYFFLDMHQDLYGGYLTGDGAPGWACLTDGAKFKPAKLVWAEGYFWGKAVHNSFDNFWNNAEYEGVPLQTYFRDMWKHTAERFKDHPALFGFDLLNEPFPGSDGGKVFKKLIGKLASVCVSDKRFKIGKALGRVFGKEPIRVIEPFDDPSLFRKVTRAGDELVRKFDLGSYSRFLNGTAKAIREVTDAGIIMMENCYYSNLGIPFSTPAINYDGKREEKICFAPHAYDLMVDTPAYKYASNSRVGSIFDEHKRSQDRLDVPVVVGEWGSRAEGVDWLFHIDYLLDKFDKNQWSQTYWCYYDGMLDDCIMSSLRRTAPVAVCGSIIEYFTDRKNGVFTLIYKQDAEYESSSEIYVHKKPKEIFTDGEYVFEPSGDEGAGLLKVKTSPGVHKVVISF